MAKLVINLWCVTCGNTHPHLPFCPRGYFNIGIFPSWVVQEQQSISARCRKDGMFQNELYYALINMLILEMEYRAAHGDPDFRRLRDQVTYNYAVDQFGVTTSFHNGFTATFTA